MMKKTVREILNLAINETDRQLELAKEHLDHWARINLQELKKQLVRLREELS
jgi:hypothetical protein